MIEVFLRDVHVFAETGTSDFITNADQFDVIQKFHKAQPNARIGDMLKETDEIRISIRQNVNSRLSLIVLANRFYLLMRGHDVIHPLSEPWTRLPSVVI